MLWGKNAASPFWFGCYPLREGVFHWKRPCALSLDRLVGNLHIGSFGSALFRVTGTLDVCQRGAVNVPKTLYPEALHNRQIGISGNL